MRLMLFVGIAVAALVAGVLSLKMTSSAPPPAPVVVQQAPAKVEAVKTADVLVAKTTIAVGTVLDASMVDVQPWPEHLVLDGFVLGQPGGEGVIGKVVRVPMRAHEPFIAANLANPNDPGFIAAGLPAGMRAITIATDVVSGVAGYIFAGDRVDVIFTHDAATEKSTGKPSVSEVIAANLRVLAVNLREGGDPNKSNSTAPNSLTLEIPDELAQRVRLAEKNGVLSVALRSIHDEDSALPKPSTVADLSRAAGASDVSEVTVVRGPGKGGDITATKLVQSLASGSAGSRAAGGEVSGK